MTAMSFPPMYQPCGSIAYFDHSSGIGHRCDTCGAVIGSIGQPRECKEEAKKYEAWEAIGGAGWDYRKGKIKEKSKVA